MFENVIFTKYVVVRSLFRFPHNAKHGLVSIKSCTLLIRFVKAIYSIKLVIFKLEIINYDSINYSVIKNRRQL